MNRRLKWFIVGSVMLNLLLIGILIGNAGRHAFDHRPPPPPMEALMDRLSPETRRILDERMERMREEGDNLRSQLREMRRQSQETLKAEPFDRERYLDQMRRMQEVRASMMTHMAEAIADVAAHATPQEREILAGMFRRPPRGDKPPPPPPEDAP